MNIGIIGVGAVAQTHIRALLKNGINVSALCDVETEKCQKALADYNLKALIFDDYVKMLDSVPLDAIHVCTPHYLHAPIIIEGLKRNVNVLSEKPLAINEKQLSEIEKAIKSTKAQLGVCFQNRYNDAVLYVKKLLDGKRIISASLNLIWNRNADYYNSGEWRGTKDKEGGGVMINQAIHGLDLVQWICGMPESVVGYTANVSLKGVIEVEDTAFGMFTFSDGGNFIVQATNAGKCCFPIYYMFRTENEIVELSGDNIIVNGRFITKSDGLPLFGKDVWGTGHIKLIGDFYDCLKTGRRFPIGYEEAKNAVILIRGLYKSHGKKISFKV